MLNPRRVLTRAQLLEHVWDYDFGGDARVLETYVSYLRKKLDAHGPPLIHTVRGVGYALRRAARVMALAARPAHRGRARARRGRAAAARRRSRTPSSARSCSTASTSRRAGRAGRRRRRAGRRRARAGDVRDPTAHRGGGPPPRRRPRPACRPAPTASGATPTARCVDGRSCSATARASPRRRRCRRNVPIGKLFTVDGTARRPATASTSRRDPGDGDIVVVAVPLHRRRPDAATACCSSRGS